ncbi:MAG: FAD-dependent oxidoreductase [Gemmatimonadota bacterium]
MTHPEALEVRSTGCCIVGAGPAGAFLGLLLARAGVETVLLEAHQDFDREFRGDTIHPSVMELLDAIGLADRLLEIPHAKLRRGTIQTADGPVTVLDMTRLRTRFPWVTMLPQTRFLEFLTREAARYPTFELRMGANVKELVREGERVAGVRYPDEGGWREVRSPLTVAADGRFSKVRRLLELEPIRTSPPMDVLWFRLPRAPSDGPPGAAAGFAGGRILVLLDRGESWQVGLVIPKGSFADLRRGGIEALHRAVLEIAPWFEGRLGRLREWSDVSFLQVESDRLPRWWVPGLLLIGDAAHVMSPVGGVGINYAVQDAVAAFEVLGEPLKTGRLELRHLANVQRRRERPTRAIQALQSLVQRRVVAPALQPAAPIRLPRLARLLTRMPLVRDLPGWLVGLGPREAAGVASAARRGGIPTAGPGPQSRRRPLRSSRSRLQAPAPCAAKKSQMNA